MKKIKIVFAFTILTIFGCSKTDERRDSNVLEKDQSARLAKEEADGQPIIEATFDKLKVMPIINHLIESSIWFNNERDWWFANRDSIGDSIKSIVLNNTMMSGKFTNKMYK